MRCGEEAGPPLVAGKEEEMEKIRVDDMHLHYGDYHALRGVSISFSDREITALIGPSGCGKSTLLKSLNRMNDLVGGCRIQGRILLDG